MTVKKELRGAATHNGAHLSNSIIADRRLKKKVRNSILKGTYFGALLAAIFCCMYTEVNPFLGCVTCAAAVGYMGLFRGVNSDDEMFGGESRS